jgi:hypothetical protein
MAMKQGTGTYSRIDRQTLVQRYHFRHVSGVFRPVCAWCGEVIYGAFDIHEYLVKRSHVKSDLERIMVPENMVPLHHECHMEKGQTREMRQRCLLYACQSLGAKRVAEWYREFVEINELQLPVGAVVPPKQLPPTVLRKYLRDGALVARRELPEGWVIEGSSALDLAPLAWAGQTSRVTGSKLAKLRVSNHDSWDYPQLIRLCDEGYWYNYLLSLGG